jgi:hypothetical protein
MLRQKIFLVSFVLVVLALVFFGCSSGGGSNNGGGDNNGNGGGNNGDGFDFSVYIGRWKSVDLKPAIEITVQSQIGGGDSYLYYKGKTTCSIFNAGYVNITDSDDDLLGDKFILAHKTTIGDTITDTFHVRAREEYEDELLGTLANELLVDGFLSDANTLRVENLEMSRQETGFSYTFDSKGEGDYLLFTKQ